MEQDLFSRVTEHQRPNGKQLILVIDMISQLIKGGMSDSVKIASVGQKICEVFLETSSNEAVW